MAIFRIEKTKDYTITSNYHLKEKNMSLKAKGLLSLMLSLPDNWDYSIAGLVSICKENESSINSTLAELKQFGYLKVDKFMPNQTKSGRIEYVYTIFENPNTQKQEDKKQGLENQGVEFQCLENPLQLNTNNIITKNKELNNIKKEKENLSKNERQTFKKCKADIETIDSVLETIENKDLKFNLQEFIKMRKAIKKPLTTYAFKLRLADLNKLSCNIDEQVEIVKQSVSSCWQDFYPLKKVKQEEESFSDMMARLIRQEEEKEQANEN